MNNTCNNPAFEETLASCDSYIDRTEFNWSMKLCTCAHTHAQTEKGKSLWQYPPKSKKRHCANFGSQHCRLLSDTLSSSLSQTLAYVITHSLTHTHCCSTQIKHSRQAWMRREEKWHWVITVKHYPSLLCAVTRRWETTLSHVHPWLPAAGQQRVYSRFHSSSHHVSFSSSF